MANFILVQFLILLLSQAAWGKLDAVYSEGHLGEKRLDSYSGRYEPLIFLDVYQGKMSFFDENYFQNFFANYIFNAEKDYSDFLNSELIGGMTCPNETLAKHFEDIKYSYRLITLSYLLEGEWHMKLTSERLGLKNGCGFDLLKWAKTCQAQSPEMKKFIGRLIKFNPQYDESLPPAYSKDIWLNEHRSKQYKWYSHYRLSDDCKGSCDATELAQKFREACEEDQTFMTLICSEKDELYGLAGHRDAYYLLGRSNIINTYNQQGQAVGCLKRFSEVMGHREVKYPLLDQLFPSLESFLVEKYQERFLQGRVFFYGAAKEFEDKGLGDNFYAHQKVEAPVEVKQSPAIKLPEIKKVDGPKDIEEKIVTPTPELPAKKEIKSAIPKSKSAFLQASEHRAEQNLDRMNVDMQKLRYDYIFSLNMINTLTERLKNFMTREALSEMRNYDKLGTKEAPVPLLFLKFLVDMQEHQGLWNIISVLGSTFYVSNEIDESFKPRPELIEITNNTATSGHWQLTILKP